MKVTKTEYINQSKVSRIKELIRLKRIVIYEETFLIECRLKDAKQIALNIIDLINQVEPKCSVGIYCVVTDTERNYKYNRIYNSQSTTLNDIEFYYDETKSLPNLLIFHYGIKFSKQDSILELFDISGEDQNIPYIIGTYDWARRNN